MNEIIIKKKSLNHNLRSRQILLFTPRPECKIDTPKNNETFLTPYFVFLNVFYVCDLYIV